MDLLNLLDISLGPSKGCTKCQGSKVYLVVSSKFYESVFFSIQYTQKKNSTKTVHSNKILAYWKCLVDLPRKTMCTVNKEIADVCKMKPVSSTGISSANIYITSISTCIYLSSKHGFYRSLTKVYPVGAH